MRWSIRNGSLPIGRQFVIALTYPRLHRVDEEHAIFEISVPNGWVGKTIGQLDIRKKYDINIMALKHNGVMNLRISPDTYLPKDDTMLVLGDIKSIQKCFHI